MSERGVFANARGVEVRRLRYFVAVAEELHFGRAAERLNVAQPALSRQIVHLEEAVGAALFDRTRNQIKLTAAGEALLPRARDILGRIVDAAEVARRASEGSTGVLTVGFVGSATYSLLPRLLNDFRTANPLVDLVLHAMNTAELRTALIERRIEAAFARPRINDPEVVNLALLEEPLIAALPEGDALAEAETIPLSQLATRPFIVYPHQPRPSFADAIVEVCRTAGFTPLIAQQTMDLQTALGLIAVGAGVSLVPKSVEDSRRHGVIYRPLAAPVPTTVLSFSYRRDSSSAVLAQFRRHVRLFVNPRRLGE